jgi:hypothetical protein
MLLSEVREKTHGMIVNQSDQRERHGRFFVLGHGRYQAEGKAAGQH